MTLCLTRDELVDLTGAMQPLEQLPAGQETRKWRKG